VISNHPLLLAGLGKLDEFLRWVEKMSHHLKIER
jgi:hypothetical protein